MIVSMGSSSGSEIGGVTGFPPPHPEKTNVTILRINIVKIILFIFMLLSLLYIFLNI